MQRKLAKILVYNAIHRHFGGHLRFAISGGPMPPEVRDFFVAVGLPLLQGDGLPGAEADPS